MTVAQRLLAKFPWPDADPVAALRGALGRACALEVFRTVGSGEGYAYIELADGHAHERSPGAAPGSPHLSPAIAVECALDRAIATELTLIADIAGAATGARAPFRYVVETDVLAEREDDFNAWYEREHLPGLAAVAGTVRAIRYRNSGAGPRYQACYDLMQPETVSNPDWLAVRATPWSSRVRPVFHNTKRTMFRRIAHAEDNACTGAIT